MYRRLELTSRRLEWLGLTHQTNCRTMLERLAGADPSGPLRVLADIVTPVSIDGRELAGTYTLHTPLNRLVDTALPESRIAREFSNAVSTMNRTNAD